MCLIAWNWQPGSDTPLLLIGNRDEFYARPTQALHWWAEAENGKRVLAGKDLQAGGTWLGLATDGRLAALTNMRSRVPVRNNTPSRGELVTDFLQSTVSAGDYLLNLQQRSTDYNPFNLLVFDGQMLLGFHSSTAHIQEMQAGIGAVSNADFETPWPKLLQLRQGLELHLEAPPDMQPPPTKALMALLQDRQITPDAQLPQTGIALEWERSLSATFIATEHYGTRASSVIKISKSTTEFSELSYGPEGALGTLTQYCSPRNCKD